ncbi:MAG: hypothetical protein J6Y02_02525 [Pseudobutyrivibrio sp.]|nr:hypothetical protein [Pseudobutyrivibrio sp.]
MKKKQKKVSYKEARQNVLNMINAGAEELTGMHILENDVQNGIRAISDSLESVAKADEARKKMWCEFAKAGASIAALGTNCYMHNLDMRTTTNMELMYNVPALKDAKDLRKGFDARKSLLN